MNDSGTQPPTTRGSRRPQMPGEALRPARDTRPCEPPAARFEETTSLQADAGGENVDSSQALPSKDQQTKKPQRANDDLPPHLQSALDSAVMDRSVAAMWAVEYLVRHWFDNDLDGLVRQPGRLVTAIRDFRKGRRAPTEEFLWRYVVRYFAIRRLTLPRVMPEAVACAQGTNELEE